MRCPLVAETASCWDPTATRVLRTISGAAREEADRGTTHGTTVAGVECDDPAGEGVLF